MSVHHHQQQQSRVPGLVQGHVPVGNRYIQQHQHIYVLVVCALAARKDRRTHARAAQCAGTRSVQRTYIYGLCYTRCPCLLLWGPVLALVLLLMLYLLLMLLYRCCWYHVHSPATADADAAAC